MGFGFVLRSVKRYDQIFPYLQDGVLLSNDIPNEYEDLMAGATAESFSFVE